jgi:TorA maturation chaperone TorD
LTPVNGAARDPVPNTGNEIRTVTTRGGSMLAHDPRTDTAQEEFCTRLASCYGEPGPAFDAEDVFGPMLAAARKLDGDLAKHVGRLEHAFAADGRARLVEDYRRLFEAPADRVAPVETAWHAGPPDATSALRELYAQGGFEVDASYRDVPDHIAAELAFLNLLIFRDNQAQRIGTPDECEACAELRQRFLDEHLAHWIGPFAAAMRSYARTGYYRELAELTERFMAIEGVAKAMA